VVREDMGKFGCRDVMGVGVSKWAECVLLNRRIIKN
jgi:hypothetical protein